MKRNLPLRALAAFEAAARLESFRAAAQELALTPSAVSYQVRILEARLGLRLFDRIGRGVVLSPEGSELFGRIGGSFDALAEAVETAARRGRRARRSEVVLLRTPPSLAGSWVLPRLPPSWPGTRRSTCGSMPTCGSPPRPAPAPRPTGWIWRSGTATTPPPRPCRC